MRKYLSVPLVILTFLIAITIGLVLYGKGYRIGLSEGKPGFSGTGMLVATSVPDGAQVFVNDHLTTATDNTINLIPGEYRVKIFKEGYFPWEKKIIIKKEVVSETKAVLFPTAPKLENITTSGIDFPVLDPSRTKIAYVVASQSATKKRGVYVLDMSTRPILTLQNSATQIADDSINLLSLSKLTWSPNGKEILATYSGSTYLLNSDGFNDNPLDVTETMITVDSNWQKMKADKEKAELDSLSKKLRQVVADNFEIKGWSEDNSKVLYVAKTNSDIPIIKSPRLIGVNSTEEQRTIKKGGYYVYDLKEDRNYKLMDEKDSDVSLVWFPDSRHLLYAHDQKVEVIEFDGTNKTTIYAGPFVGNSAFPWPDGTKVVILTNLGNPTITPNLYTISLK